MDHAAAIKRLYDLINAGDIDGFGELLAEDFVRRGNTRDWGRTKEGVKQLFHMSRASFPICAWRSKNVLVSGDKAVARVRATGTHQGEFWAWPPPARASTSGLIDITRFGDDGLAREHWGVFDALAMMQQAWALSRNVPG